MSRVFNGSVSITTKTTKMGVKVLTLKADPNGKWNSDNVGECFKKVMELHKSEGLPLDEWMLFAPKLAKGEKASPVLLARKRFGTPYIAILAAQKTAVAAKVETKPQVW
jgi:hypothetical protein